LQREFSNIASPVSKWNVEDKYYQGDVKQFHLTSSIKFYIFSYREYLKPDRLLQDVF
jgi:hypothetical protein